MPANDHDHRPRARHSSLAIILAVVFVVVLIGGGITFLALQRNAIRTSPTGATQQPSAVAIAPAATGEEGRLVHTVTPYPRSTPATATPESRSGAKATTTAEPTNTPTGAKPVTATSFTS